MAIFHLRARTVGRASGASAAAAAAYILRRGRYAKADIDPCVFSQSANMPAWAAGPRQRLEYWRAADLHERANGRLFKSLEFALPRELNHGQRVALAREFCNRLARTDSGEPLPILMAVHAGKGSNPHAHVMVSERILDGHDRTPDLWFSRASPKGQKPGLGGARKSGSLKPREWLQGTRELLARLTNQALATAGFAARVDHRSLREQGIERTPDKHLGPAAAARLHRGAHSWRAEDLVEERAAQASTRGLITELQREAGQVAEELTHLQTSAGLPGGTAALLAKARRDGSRDNSKSKPKGIEYDTPNTR